MLIVLRQMSWYWHQFQGRRLHFQNHFSIILFLGKSAVQILSTVIFPASHCLCVFVCVSSLRKRIRRSLKILRKITYIETGISSRKAQVSFFYSLTLTFISKVKIVGILKSKRISRKWYEKELTLLLPLDRNSSSAIE